MNCFRFRIAQFVFLCTFLSWSSVSAQGDSALFHCLTPDSAGAAAPAGQQILSPVAFSRKSPNCVAGQKSLQMQKKWRSKDLRYAKNR